MIESIIKQHKQHFNTRLQDWMADTQFPAAKIQQAMHYGIFPGGKRLRPLLVYLGGELLDVKPEILDTIATSIELIHCYSLIHDDLPAMDDDDLRRGMPTCHRAFDEATAILAGDGLQALAIEMLFSLDSHLNAKRVIAIAKEITHACGPFGMVSGQSLDLTELNQNNIDESCLERVHRLKTGALISACINCVIHASEHPERAVNQNLQQFGTQLGLAFQVQDDYLDKYSNTQQLGKPQGSDETNNKTTYASLYSKEHLLALINQRYQQAIATLSVFGPQANKLQAFTNYLQQRSH